MRAPTGSQFLPGGVPFVRSLNATPQVRLRGSQPTYLTKGLTPSVQDAVESVLHRGALGCRMVMGAVASVRQEILGSLSAFDQVIEALHLSLRQLLSVGWSAVENRHGGGQGSCSVPASLSRAARRMSSRS